jgi:hypothetical protein
VRSVNQYRLWKCLMPLVVIGAYKAEPSGCPFGQAFRPAAC